MPQPGPAPSPAGIVEGRTLTGLLSDVVSDTPSATTAPSDDRGGRPDLSPDPKAGPAGGWGKWGARADGDGANGRTESGRPKYERPSEEEMTRVRAFMQDNMPKSLEALNSGQGRPMRIQIVAASQYRRLERIKRDHPDRKDLQDAVLDDAHSWDELGSLFREWPTAESDRRQEIRKLARPFALKIYENNLAERRVRLEALKQSVIQEEGKLAKDETSKDEMVDRKLNGMIQDLGHSGMGNGGRMTGRRPPDGSPDPAPPASPAPPAPPAPDAPNPSTPETPPSPK